jgi:lipopolysaccharide biosynthesis protein
MQITKNAFVIAHYHPRGIVANNLVNLIQYISKSGAEIIFVSTNITKKHEALISGYAKVISRENFGYDFWSYKIGIDNLSDINKFDRIVIFNSSFISYSPAILCDPFLSPVTRPLLRGITISHYGDKHIQSFWVAFEHKELIQSNAFGDWWNSMKPISEKKEVIKEYELGMSRFFLQNGFQLEAIFTPSLDELFLAFCRAVSSGIWRIQLSDSQLTIDINNAKRLNPSHYLWDSLFRNLGIVKVELLRDNPTNMNLARLIETIASSEDFRKMTLDAIDIDLFNPYKVSG